MLRTHSIMLTAALVCGGLLARAQPVNAQHGHGHGGHGGGHGHGHGGHGWGHGHAGYGWGHGHSYGGHGHYYGYPSFGFGLGYYSGYGYPGYYAYPRYSYPAYGPVYYDAYYYGASRPATEPVAPPSHTARVELRLPDPEAQVWIDGAKTSVAGRTRTYESPRLDPGPGYTYTVTAAWNKDGRIVTEERKVAIEAGKTTLVDFTRPAAATSKQPAAAGEQGP